MFQRTFEGRSSPKDGRLNDRIVGLNTGIDHVFRSAEITGEP